MFFADGELNLKHSPISLNSAADETETLDQLEDGSSCDSFYSGKFQLIAAHRRNKFLNGMKIIKKKKYNQKNQTITKQTIGR